MGQPEGSLRAPEPGVELHRPRLLFLAQTLPFPPDGGVNIRTYNVLRLLARRFDVTALCFYRTAVRPNADLVAESLRGLAPLGQIEAFLIPQEHSRVRLLADHARSLLQRQAYTLMAYESAAYAARVRELVESGTFDLVHMDSLDLTGYLPLLGRLPVAVTHHNVESQLLGRRAQAESSAFRRFYLQRQAEWTAQLERAWCPRVNLNIAVSEPDRQIFARLAPSASFGVVPNGVDVETFQPTSGPQDGVVFVGGSTWFPNRDALDFFSESILPLIRAAGSRPVVRWVGRSTPESQREFKAVHDIELTGYVDDVRPWVAKAACYVVPLRVGGGTRLKILDAWAMGKAVVSTSVGCEGLDARDGENILVRDDPAAFASAVREVLADAELRERLGRAARSTVERLYSWDVIGVELERLYGLLVAGESAMRRSRDTARSSGMNQQVSSRVP